MSTPKDSKFWMRVRRARTKLEDDFIQHPDVRLIDIGYDPERGEGTKQVVLRIHVASSWMEADPDNRAAFPEEVDGIPVVAVRGDYYVDNDLDPQ